MKTRIISITLLILAVILCGCVSVAHGVDGMWDLKNYHLYDPFAALNNRYTIDIAPAQQQSYLNPFLDFPFYFAIRCFNDHPRLISFMMGLVQGINLWAVGMIAWLCLNSLGLLSRIKCLALTALATMIGATGAGSVPLIGSTTGDLSVATPILLSLLLLVHAISRSEVDGRPYRAALFGAGLCTGLAVGAKPTMVVFATGLFVACIWMPRGKRVWSFFQFSVGGAIGFIVTGAYHHVRLFLLFENPFFPLMNGLFRSPYWEYMSFRDTRFLPTTFFNAVIEPFKWAVAGEHGLVSEIDFRDIRVALALTLGVLTIAVWIIQALKREKTTLAIPAPIFALCIFGFVSYISWLLLFSIYRYILVLEMLSGLFIILGLMAVLRPRVVPFAATACVIACIGTTIPLEWGHSPFRDRYIDVSGPTLEPNTLVLIVGPDPVAYFIPFIRSDATWLGLQNNLLSPDQRNLLVERERITIAGHTGPMMVLAAGVTPSAADATLGKFGLARDDRSTCDTLSSNLGAERYSLCPVLRRLN